MKLFHKKEKLFTVYFVDRSKMKITLFQYSQLFGVGIKERVGWYTFMEGIVPIKTIKFEHITHIK